MWQHASIVHRHRRKELCTRQNCEHVCNRAASATCVWGRQQGAVTLSTNTDGCTGAAILSWALGQNQGALQWGAQQADVH